MRIALLGTGIISGGLISVLRDLLSYEPDEDIEIRFYCPPGFTNVIPSINKRIVVVETDDAIESKISKVFGISYPKGLINLIDSFAPDAVFFVTGSYKKGLEKYETYFILNNQLYTNYLLLSRQKNIKLFLYMSILSFKFRNQIKNIKHVFFSSQYSKEETEKVVSVKDAKVISFACNSIFYQNVIKKVAPINKDDFTILCIGSIIPYKNQLSVIKATKSLIDKGYGVKLRLIGSVISNRYYNECIRYIKNNNIDKYVEHIKNLPLDDIPNIIDCSDIYVNSSETDTCGTAVEEGMARGQIVIGNNVGFNQEMIGDTGLYFDVNDPETLVEAVERVIKDKDMQIELRKRAYLRSRERTLKDTTREYYEYIIQNHRKRRL